MGGRAILLASNTEGECLSIDDCKIQSDEGCEILGNIYDKNLLLMNFDIAFKMFESFFTNGGLENL